jgi:hypothetical protein
MSKLHEQRFAESQVTEATTVWIDRLGRILAAANSLRSADRGFESWP